MAVRRRTWSTQRGQSATALPGPGRCPARPPPGHRPPPPATTRPRRTRHGRQPLPPCHRVAGAVRPLPPRPAQHCQPLSRHPADRAGHRRAAGTAGSGRAQRGLAGLGAVDRLVPEPRQPGAGRGHQRRQCRADGRRPPAGRRPGGRLAGLGHRAVRAGLGDPVCGPLVGRPQAGLRRRRGRPAGGADVRGGRVADRRRLEPAAGRRN